MRETVKNLEKHVRVLTDEIGVRLAGSNEERRAAEYLREACLQYTPYVSIEEFPVNERNVTSEKLEIEINGAWKEYSCSLFSSAPSTNGISIDAELVYFDTTTGYQREDLSFLTGKAVVHLGCHIENEDNYRRLLAAKPAFILFVDTRYPGNVRLADGLFPAYVKKFGAVPSLNVAYMDVWNWQKNHALHARICIEGGIRKSMTSVVVCEIPGTDPDSGIIYAGGHHDTQAQTVGADDNAIGSAAIVELARILSQKPHKRTFRLCSFGAEEQLSYGSASYVRAHWAEIAEKGIFMCNFDTFGSLMGWYEFTVNAALPMRQLLKNIFNKNDIYYSECIEPCPYTDQFPFAACGVPGCWLFRKNCTSGIFYHHRIDNTPDKIGFDTAAQVVKAAGELLANLADSEDISAFCGIPEEQQLKIDELYNTVYAF